MKYLWKLPETKFTFLKKKSFIDRFIILYIPLLKRVIEKVAAVTNVGYWKQNLSKNWSSG